MAHFDPLMVVMQGTKEEELRQAKIEEQKSCCKVLVSLAKSLDNLQHYCDFTTENKDIIQHSMNNILTSMEVQIRMLRGTWV